MTEPYKPKDMPLEPRHPHELKRGQSHYSNRYHHHSKHGTLDRTSVRVVEWLIELKKRRLMTGLG